MRIVFFGTPEFAVRSLAALIDAGHDIAAVVTMPDKTGGRGNKVIESDIKKYALSQGLPILQPVKLRDPLFIEDLKNLNADLFIVIAFRMLPETVWKIPPLGTINLHASILPQLRGAAPINHAIINGFEHTGVTTFLINEEIDKGGILFTEKVKIEERENAGSLHDKLMEEGSRLIVKTVEKLGMGEVNPIAQTEDDNLIPAPKIFKNDCKIDFHNSAVDIDRMVRGLAPYPSAWAILELENGKQIDVKIQDANPNMEKNLPAGKCEVANKKFMVGTLDNAIEIRQLQPAGKKPMTAEAFLAGYHPVRFV